MRSFLLLLVCGVLVGAACSPAQSSAPVLGDCPADGGCGKGGVGGGGGSGGSGSSSGGDDGGSCQASSTDSQCNQCADTSCCTSLLDCDSACQSLLSCAQFCASSSCISTCESQNPSGTSGYQTLAACLQSHCPICSESGAGDSCASCVAGLTCNGQWCTKNCARSSDCTGIGANGGNLTGNLNACLNANGVDSCWPGCSGDGDCTQFPGTYCRGTTDISGAAVQVCSPIADAGTAG